VSSNSLGMVIESLVAILLALTIIYCVMLNERLKMLKSNEQSLRATISELITATEIAERAIGSLKETVRDGDATLGERLRAAGRVTIGLDLQIAAGRDVLGRLTPVVDAARQLQEQSRETPAPAAAPAPEQAPAPVPVKDPREVAADAHAFGERLRNRVYGLAA
jgi:hypothetical protein